MAHHNQYKANLRDLSFLLFEQFKLEELLGKAPYANWGKDEVDRGARGGLRLGPEVPRPVQRDPATTRAAGSTTARSTSRPASRRRGRRCSRPAGARSRSTRSTAARPGPFTLAMMVEEFMCGSNTSFNMYPALTQGAADVILAFGTPEQQATLRAQDVRRHVGGHDVPDRAARRQRRRLARARRRPGAPTASTTSTAPRSSSPAAIRT